MVALLVRLRFRVLATTLSRNTWQLVAVILGGLQAIPILLVVVVASVVLGGFGPGPIHSAVVLAGGAVVLGWAVVPMLFNGVEQTLHPVRLAPFPIPPSRIIAAGMLVGLCWVPGATTVLAGVSTAIAWRMQPVSAVAAVPSALLAVATAIALSRAVATVTGNLIAGRRPGVRAVAVVGSLLVLGGPVVGAIAAASRAPAGSGLDAAAAVIAWTPLGAAWAVPGWIALGRPLAAVGAAALALAALALVLLVWRIALGASLRHRGAGGPLAGHRRGLGWIGRVPARPTAAIAARSLHYWFHDVRLARQLIILPLMPGLFLVWSRVTGADGLAIASGPVTAALLPLAVFAGLSYDGTAFASELAAGIRGVHDRIGRAVALLVIGAPAVVAIELVIAVVEGLGGSLPALVGMSVGVLLCATGVVSVSSARIVIPVPRPGRTPFSAAAGAGATSIGASYAVTGITAAVAAPALVLGTVALVTGSAALGWVALAVGIVLGAAALVGGILLGGSVLDARGPEVLARLRAVRA